PVVQYTARSWPPPGSAADPLWSRRRRRANTGTYQQAIVPKISTAEVALPSSTISAVQSITDDLTRFDAQYPGGAPFSAVLLRSESTASSQIEHLTANARRISLARLGDHSRVNASLLPKTPLLLRQPLSWPTNATSTQFLLCTMHSWKRRNRKPQVPYVAKTCG